MIAELYISGQGLQCVFFFFNDTATTEIYTLSLHDALPIWSAVCFGTLHARMPRSPMTSPRKRSSRPTRTSGALDRKSTRLNSSHANISYAVFCLKKKINCIRHASSRICHLHTDHIILSTTL